MRMSEFLKLSLIAALVLGGTSVFARMGNADGGGGKGVVCVEQQTGKRTVELLDLYELRILKPGQTLVPSTGTLDGDVRSAVARLSDFYPATIGELRTATPKEFAELVSIKANTFLNGTNAQLLKLHNVVLLPTQDDYTVVRPVNCTIEQIVSYHSGDVIWRNEDLFSEMDTLNKAALTIHEALYTSLREYDNEGTSIRVRRAIGAIFSGTNFSIPPVQVPKQVVECSAGDEAHLDTIFSFWLSHEPNRAGTKSNLNFFPQRIFGEQLLGAELRNFVIPLNKDFSQALNPKNFCQVLGSMNGIWMYFNGPIEFDRHLEWLKNCSSQDATVYVKTTVPGELKARTIGLKCSMKTISK